MLKKAALFALLMTACQAFAADVFVQQSRWRGAPIFRNVGSFNAGTTTCAPGAVGSTAVGDLLIAVVASANTATPTAAGYTQIGTTQAAGVTGISLFYRVATGSDGFSGANCTDHCFCRLIGYKPGGANTSNPVAATTSNTQGSTTSVSITSPTTGATAGNTILACAVADIDGLSTVQFSAEANTDDADSTVAERMDNCNATGTGGCIMCAEVETKKRGTIAATTATFATATPTAWANASVAIRNP